MDFDKIMSSLEKREFAPVYFLSGEQTYYIDEITSQIENGVLDDAERDFNQTVVYGRDVNSRAIISYAKRYPMMSEYQVVIVKEAQDVKDIMELEPYIKSPLQSTILVLCYKYKSLDKRKGFAKAISKHGVLFEAPAVRDYQVPTWISGYLKKHGYSAGPRECALLADHLGNNLSKVVNELKKLFINIPQGTTITPDHIEENIGISKEYNVFEYQTALSLKDRARATRISNFFAANEKDHPLPMITAVVFSYFLKIGLYHELQDKSKHSVAKALKVNPFFVKDYEQAAKVYSKRAVARTIGILHEYDIRSKGMGNVGVSGSELIREMTYRILAQD